MQHCSSQMHSSQHVQHACCTHVHSIGSWFQLPLDSSTQQAVTHLLTAAATGTFKQLAFIFSTHIHSHGPFSQHSSSTHLQTWFPKNRFASNKVFFQGVGFGQGVSKQFPHKGVPTNSNSFRPTRPRGFHPTTRAIGFLLGGQQGQQAKAIPILGPFTKGFQTQKKQNNWGFRVPPNFFFPTLWAFGISISHFWHTPPVSPPRGKPYNSQFNVGAHFPHFTIWATHNFKHFFKGTNHKTKKIWAPNQISIGGWVWGAPFVLGLGHWGVGFPFPFPKGGLFHISRPRPFQFWVISKGPFQRFLGALSNEGNWHSIPLCWCPGFNSFGATIWGLVQGWGPRPFSKFPFSMGLAIFLQISTQGFSQFQPKLPQLGVPRPKLWVQAPFFWRTTQGQNFQQLLAQNSPQAIQRPIGSNFWGGFNPLGDQLGPIWGFWGPQFGVGSTPNHQISHLGVWCPNAQFFDFLGDFWDSFLSPHNIFFFMGVFHKILPKFFPPTTLQTGFLGPGSSPKSREFLNPPPFGWVGANNAEAAGGAPFVGGGTFFWAPRNMGAFFSQALGATKGASLWEEAQRVLHNWGGDKRGIGVGNRRGGVLPRKGGFREENTPWGGKTLWWRTKQRNLCATKEIVDVVLFFFFSSVLLSSITSYFVLSRASRHGTDQ